MLNKLLYILINNIIFRKFRITNFSQSIYTYPNSMKSVITTLHTKNIFSHFIVNPFGKFFLPFLLLFLVGLGSGEAFGQPSITSTTPKANFSNISVNSNIVIVFDDNINGSTVNASNIVVSGNRTGLIEGSFSGGGTTTIVFNPTIDFKFGEIITVSVTIRVEGSGGGG